MSLDEYFNVEGGEGKKYVGPYREVEEYNRDIVAAYKESRYAIEVFGFLPVSVWYVKRGKYRGIVEKYSKYIHTKKIRRDGVTGLGTHKLGRIPFSIRLPGIDERVYKLFSFPGALVYNPFLGHTIEYIIAGRMGMDYWGSTVNQYIIHINQKFYDENRHLVPRDMECKFWLEDATTMDSVDSNSVDMIWCSPPYWRAEVYPSDHPNEMSKTETYDEFLDLYRQSAKQIYRVLKPNRYAVLQVGDVRFNNIYYPLGMDTVNIFRDAGFKLHDIIILVNINPVGWVSGYVVVDRRYTIKTHEYIVVFRKV